MNDMTFTFTAPLKIYQGQAAWHYIIIPTDHADQIKFFREKPIGFGSVPVNVTCGQTTWQTSLFPDKKSASYMLPIKKDVRVREKLSVGDDVEIKIEVKTGL